MMEIASCYKVSGTKKTRSENNITLFLLKKNLTETTEKLFDNLNEMTKLRFVIILLKRKTLFQRKLLDDNVML